jgi:UDP-N-acetylmuramate dehydrogenase
MKKMKTIDELSACLERSCGRAPLRDESLAGHSFFRIGGPADLYFKALTIHELATALGAARQAGLRRVVIGGGANILFDDAGFRGLVIRNAASGLVQAEEDGRLIEADSGTPLEDVVEFAAARGLSGMAFLAGIPGTVGGAVYGNAGAYRKSVGDILDYVLLLGTDGRERRAVPAELEFAYRHSALKARPDIILGAGFRLSSGREAEIRAEMAEHLEERARKHPPPGTAYPGSYFKNPPTPGGGREPAGRLLQQAGACGLQVGGAKVYAGHGNMIINAGGASARDVLALAAELKRRVAGQFGISLEEEVIYLPADGPGS